MKNKKWQLSIGCHDGTLTGRDSELREFDSLEECKNNLKESERFWNSIGHFVWFATAYGPNGEELSLHPGTPYRRY